MPNPLPFTEEEMKQVFATNLIEYAASQGFAVEKADRKTYHVKGNGGLYLFPKGYHHFSRGESGNIIDFAREYQGLSFITAVETILGTKAYANTLPPLPPTPERGELIVPPKSTDIQQTQQYLIAERCLDPQIVDSLIEQGVIYQAVTKSKGTVFQNCAFVSFDKNGKPRYCSLRGMDSSRFRQDIVNSDKSYGFTMQGTGNRVFVFESPIDAISHATLMKLNGMDDTKDFRISEGCLSDKALTRFLADNAQISEVVFCFDNDRNGKDHKSNPHNHGQEFAKKCAAKFGEKGYAVHIQTPHRKDFNTDLQYIRQSVLMKLREKQVPLHKGEKVKKQDKER